MKGYRIVKTCAKVFIWIGMIIQFFLIYPIIIGVLALRKIEDASSRDELQTLGIFTTLFCSLLGGIFMLCIKDDELDVVLSTSANGVVVYKKKEIIKYENKNITPKQFKARKTIIWLVYIPLIFFVLSFLFAFLTFENQYINEDGIFLTLSFVPISIQILVYLVTLILFIVNGHTLNKLINGFLMAFGIISIIELISSIICNFCFVFILGDRIYYGGDYHISNPIDTHEHIYGVSWECWCLTAIALICVVITGIVLYLSYKTKQKDLKLYSKEIHIIETSNVEMELNETKRLLDIGLISDDEYQTVRSSVLTKYYGNE